MFIMITNMQDQKLILNLASIICLHANCVTTNDGKNINLSSEEFEKLIKTLKDLGRML